MNFYGRCFAFAFLGFALSSPAWAQLFLADLQTKISGSWLVTVEGEVRTRTMVINTVAQKGEGAYVIVGTFNFSDGKPSPFKSGEILQSSGNATFVLTTGSDSVFTGTLQPDGTITGTTKYANGQVKAFKLDKGAVAPVASADPGQKYTGTADPNLGMTSGCSPGMKYEVIVRNGKVSGSLLFAGSQNPRRFSADLGADGKFESTYQTSTATIQVWGKIGDSFSIRNPGGCGYGGMPLKM